MNTNVNVFLPSLVAVTKEPTEQLKEGRVCSVQQSPARRWQGSHGDWAEVAGHRASTVRKQEQTDVGPGRTISRPSS